MTDTKNQLLIQVTKDYIEELKKNNLKPSIKEMESSIISRQTQLIIKRNTYESDDGKKHKRQDAWTIPEYLNPYQIATILNYRYVIVKIIDESSMGDEDAGILAIYNEDGINEGIYTTYTTTLRAVVQKLNCTISDRGFKEVLNILKALVETKTICHEKNLICVGNGIIDYETKKLLPYTSEKIFVSKIKVHYKDNPTNPIITNPDNTTWDVETWFKSLSDDKEVIELLWKIVGAMIRPNVDWNKSAWFYSTVGNNGKGTLCTLLRNLCGNNSYVSIPLNRFSTDALLVPLLHATAIITDENDVGTFIDQAANLKAIITGDPISVNPKYNPAFTFRFNGFMVQCVNEFPRIKDASSSMLRRLLIIPFEKNFNGKERTYIKSDYLNRDEVLEYVLYKVVNLPSYYSLEDTTTTKSVLKSYTQYNDSVAQFWHEFKDDFTWDLLPFTFLYDLYKAWFKDTTPQGKVLSKLKFIEQLLQALEKDDDTLFICEDKSKQIKTSDKMDKPETLIYQYKLTNWLNPNVKTNDIVKLSTLANKSNSYRGLVKDENLKILAKIENDNEKTT